MKKLLPFFLAVFLLGFTNYSNAQTGLQEQIVDKDGTVYCTGVDNISYWVELAEKGLVPYNPSIPVRPAKTKSSLINIDGVVINSADIVILDNDDYIQSENSVFVDPDNVFHVLNSNNSRGWNGSSATTGYGASYFNTNNGGYNWSGSYVGAGGTNKGDPAACIGTNGRQYIGSISSGRGQGVAYSDNGSSWTYVTVGANQSSPDLLDKNHLWIDNTSGSTEGYLYDAWTNFDYYNEPYEIEFSRSTNNGVTWSTPYIISSNTSAGFMNHGVNICCNNTGWVFACWAVYDDWGSGVYGEDAIAFARSPNGGASFYPAQIIQDNILGIREEIPNPTGKNMRVNSFPSMAIDVSGGAYHGDQYVVWSNVGVPGTNTGSNVSVYMIKSTNGGTVWSTPIRINQGPSTNGLAAYFPWITCDPVTGNLFCIFYDDRDLGTSSTAVETWLAYSTDGGASWDDFRISDVSFTPSPVPGLAAGYFGDYLGVTAKDNFVYPAWTDNRSGRALTYVSPFVFGGPCIATGGGYEYISRVQIGSIDNSTGSDNYTDYTNLSTDIPLSGSDGLTVTMGNPYSASDQCGVWVDWNRDNDFDDANETIAVSGTPGLGPYTATIDPPAGTTTGECTMRVRITYTGAVEPCGATSYGEVEDYTINLTGTAGLWTGNTSTNWNTASNWDDMSVPNSFVDVTIPSGCANYPVLSGNLGINNAAYSYDCKSLTINSGASVTVNGADVISYGELTVAGTLDIGDDFTLHSGSTVNLSGSISLGVTSGWYGHAEHQAGSVFNQTGGNYYVETIHLADGCQFNGTGGTTHLYVNGDSPDNTIDVDDPNSYFKYFYVDSGANASLFDCSYDLEVTQSTILYAPFDVNSYTLNTTYMDVYTDGDLIIDSDGTVNVTGNGPYFHSDGSLSMVTGGELNCGGSIVFFTGSIENVSGGEILLEGNFTDNDEIFSPTGGSVTFDGSSASNIYGPTAFYDLNINKTGAGVIANSDFTVTKDFSINTGSFTLNGNEITVTHDCDVYGTLTMDNTSDVLTVGQNYFDQLNFWSGSSANISNGTVNIYGWIIPRAGCSFTASTSNTIVFKGVFGGGPSNFEPTAVYGNIIVDKNANEKTFIDNSATQPIVVSGSFTINPDNILEIQDKTMYINGTFTDVASSIIYVYDAAKSNGPESSTKEGDGKGDSKAKGGYLEIDTDLTINGLMDVGASGNVVSHGLFQLDATGTLTITGGSFVNDHPYSSKAWQYLYGTFNLSAGLFEIMHNSILLGSTFIDNITGGTIRTGHSFRAETAGTFEPGGGNVEFTGTQGTPFIDCDAGNYFNDFDFNSTVDYVLYSNTEVRGDVTIDDGLLNFIGYDLTCLGDMDINSGGSALINSNATLKLDNGSYFTVAVGGEVQVVGTAGSEATVTNVSTGTYSFSVWGTIGAEYAIFEYMDANGINVKTGGLVDPAYTFSHCIFRYGAPAKGSAYLVLNSSNTFTASGTYFENTTGVGNNVWKYYNTGHATFLDAFGDFAGEDYDHDPNNRIDWTYTARTLDLTVFLEGPYNSSTNKMNLGINSVLPLDQPFDDPPLSNPNPDWLYYGTESVGAIPSPYIVDWVLIELRDATSVSAALPGTAISTQAAFLTNTGNIVGLDGLSFPTFTGTITNNLYVVIWTRNHLGIISANPLVDVGGLYSYDFSSGSGQAYGGTSAQNQLSVSPVVWGMMSGDANGTGLVAPGDKINVWWLQAGETGYLESDYNYDSQADNVDKDDYWLWNLYESSFIPGSKDNDE